MVGAGALSETRDLTQEEVDEFNKMLADMGILFHTTIDGLRAFTERMERQSQVEYDEYVVGYPRITGEDLTANHAAGLPVTREHIVRCKDCEFYQRNSRCGGVLQCLNERFSYGKWGATVMSDFFCADGKPKEAE